MTNAEMAKAFLRWMLGPIAEIPEVHVLKLSAQFDAVRLDEAEWWWNQSYERHFSDGKSRMDQLRANSSGNQAK
jgi:hypothetical protein